jgi:hypothetical protein
VNANIGGTIWYNQRDHGETIRRDIFWSSDLENKATADVEYSAGSALVEKMGMAVAMCISG